MLKNVILLGFFMLLTACAHMQQPTTLPAPQDGKYSSPQQLQDWSARGSIIIISPRESTHARFSWQQRDQNYTIDFFGPLGSYHHQLFGSPGQVTLIDANGHSETAKDPETLLKNKLGWTLPVRGLNKWIRGIPGNHEGWDVQYLDYTVVNNYKLPKAMQLTYADLKVKIKIDSWGVGA